MVYDTNSDGTIDRGDHPKNAGDRGYGHGDEITLELTALDDAESAVTDGELPKGYFVDFDGQGGVERVGGADDTDDYAGTGAFEAVLKHSAEVGDEVTVHLRGAQRVAEAQDVWPVLDTYDGGDELIALR